MLAIPVKEEFMMCPSCNELFSEEDISRGDFIGGTYYREFPNESGLWFSRDDYSELEAGYCPECEEYYDINDWGDYSEVWKCKECGALSEDRSTADECC